VKIILLSHKIYITLNYCKTNLFLNLKNHFSFNELIFYIRLLRYLEVETLRIRLKYTFSHYFCCFYSI